jgi:hypothetical protein
MKLQLTVKGDPAEMMAQETSSVARGLTAAFREGGDRLKQRGRAAISAGGFSGRWQSAFRVNVYPKNGASTSPRIFAYHKIKYAGQFEDPEPVKGSPYVWIPITKNLPGGQRWNPHKYTLQIGPLRGGRHGARPLLFGQVSVNRKQRPVKLSKKGLRKSATTKVWLPVFVGVTQVNDPKRFDLAAQADKTAAELGTIFSESWSDHG